MQFASYPSLKGAVVYITGGGAGIGKDMVQAFAEQGAHVGFVDISAVERRARSRENWARQTQESMSETASSRHRRVEESVRQSEVRAWIRKCAEEIQVVAPDMIAAARDRSSTSVAMPGFPDGESRRARPTTLSESGVGASLLATIPGEKHVFGVDMVATFMRGAAWDVTVERGLDSGEIANLVATERIGIFGTTLGAETGVGTLARTVESVRRASANRSISVIVGGPVFAKTPALVAQVGADPAASDAPTAVILAKKLLLLHTAAD